VTQIRLLSIKRTLIAMLNEQKQIKPSCKVEATQTLLVTSGERMWQEAAQNARLKEMKGCE